MTRPIEMVEVRCRWCGHEFETTYRGSVSLWPVAGQGIESAEEHLRRVNSFTCPNCGRKGRVGPAVLVEVLDDVERWTFE